MILWDGTNQSDYRRYHVVCAGVSRALAHMATDPSVAAMHSELAEFHQLLAEHGTETTDPAVKAN